MLTQEEVLKLFSYDPATGIVVNRVNRGKARAGRLAGGTSTHGYAIVGVDGRRYLLHRVIFLMMTGAFPPEQIDHINGRKSDNRWRNLRAVSRVGNARNSARRRDNTSGCTGVTWNALSGKWTASICIAGRNAILGHYTYKHHAIEIRKEYERAIGFHPNHGRAT